MNLRSCAIPRPDRRVVLRLGRGRKQPGTSLSDPARGKRKPHETEETPQRRRSVAPSHAAHRS